ncbi:MAG: acyl-CoA dehydrogenase [Thermoplasmata archaeon]|nr:MAG: acyl-CoA dehydrogenase [Thermoplasmata archaeon]RLF71102.1 MAG: acyl-CoA dehydrogenase [Thermoplasmata archaeon]RLF74729.1 MAG: acyl-CoA dehydrogenase [Thermoplasmata archaeon]HDD60873.1 acyl-CoA dehydrogenase [Euryarchaeota archaeon]
MDFRLTEAQELLVKSVKEFAEREIEPVADELDKSMEYPLSNVRKMGEMGLLGMLVPPEYGGAGADTLSFVLSVEEVSKADASHGLILSVQNTLVNLPILSFASEEVKREYLTRLARGEYIGGFALTERGAGTDASAIITTARKEGDIYVLEGSKIFITSAPYARAFVVFAKTDPEAGHKGISAFLVDSKWRGVRVGEPLDKMGIRCSGQAEVFFKDVEVPSEHLLGSEGEGFKIALSTLDSGRIGIGAQAVGIAQAALEEAVKYSKEREQFGRPIAKFQAIQWMIAEMATKVEAARLLVYRAALARDTQKRYSTEAAMAKYYASEVAREVTNFALQIHGGYGYTKDYKVERLYRDAKVTEIYEGTTEAQKMVISSSYLK